MRTIDSQLTQATITLQRHLVRQFGALAEIARYNFKYQQQYDVFTRSQWLAVHQLIGLTRLKEY